MATVRSLPAALRRWARALKVETLALYLVARDPRVPWCARLFVAAVVAYALSPIDLIPDFIPVLGYLDDLIVVPLGLLLVARLMPPYVMNEYRMKAEESDFILAKNWTVAILMVAVWVCGTALAYYVLRRILRH